MLGEVEGCKEDSKSERKWKISGKRKIINSKRNN